MALGAQFRQRMLYLAPVVVSAAFGGAWVAIEAGGGRGSAHTFWQSLVVVEGTVALLLRRRKPVGSLAGVLVVYVLFQLFVITLLPALVALFTVARSHGRRGAVVAGAVTAVVLPLAPLLLGRQASVLASVGALLTAGIAAAAGRYARVRDPGEQGEA